MTFTYLAPDKRGSGGNVALEARSRRGVGKADVTLDTAQPGWTASGGGDGLTVSGLVADVGKPFELSGTFPGGTAQLTYTPTSESGGTVDYTGSGGGANAHGLRDLHHHSR